LRVVARVVVQPLAIPVVVVVLAVIALPLSGKIRAGALPLNRK
jgi:hypothetical protein